MRNRLNKIILFVALLLTNVVNSQLGTYTFTNATDGLNSPNVTTQPANGIFSAYTTVNTMDNGTGNVFNRRGWNADPIIDLTEYNSFTITPTQGYTMNLTSFIFDHQISAIKAAGNSTVWTLRSSLDNYTTNLGTGTIIVENTPILAQTVTLPVSFSSLKTAITFRLYIFEIKNGTTTWRNDNVIVNGTISALPALVTVTPSTQTICRGTIQNLTVSGGKSYSRSTNTSTALNLAIPDNSATGINNTITVAGIPASATAPEIILNLNITHVFNSDVEVNLVAPNGQIINLIADVGLSGDNFTNTKINSTNGGDDFSTALTNNFTGTFRAVTTTNANLKATANLPTTTSWSSLLGTLNGGWTIRVYDDVTGNSGTLVNWSLDIYYETLPVWTPVTDLFTNAAATIPYVTGTPPASVFAKPTVTRTYTTTASNSVLSTTQTSTSVITVTQLPIANVGFSTAVYVGDYYTVVGATATNSSSILWTHNGGGYFDQTYFPVGNETTLTPTYYVEDTDFGDVVTLTMTITGIGACIASTTSTNVTLNVDGNPGLWHYQCGTTLPYIDEYVYAYAYPGATQYRFRINGDNSFTYTTPASVFYFNLFTNPIYYNSTYSVDVSVFVSGVWSAYGPACLLTTPSIPSTQIQASQCGSTLSAINTQISANPIQESTQYRFRVSDGTTTQIVDNNNNFYFTTLASYSYGTTYTIDVATFTNGTWTTYGPSCTITTPVLSTTNIIPTQCGITIPNLDVDIYANEVFGATQYRFRVTNGSSITLNKPSRTFKLSQMSAILANTTYSVDVDVFVNGSWTGYGSACNITTPTVNMTQLIPSQCGMTLSSITTDLYANPVTGATQYKFRVTNGFGTQTVIKSSRTFKLSHVTNVEYGTVNTIDVDAFVNGSWIGYGSTCTVVTPTLPNTKVMTSQCVITLSTISTYIYADDVPGVSQWRFRLTNNGGVSYIYLTKSSRLFSFSQMTNTSYSLNSTYTIDVAVNYNGSWQSYGSTCTVTTPGAYSMVLNNDVDQLDQYDVEFLSIVSDSINSELNIFPNPFFENFEIQFDSNLNDTLEGVIYDINGKKIETINRLDNKFGIDYDPGIYFLYLKQGKVTKVVKIIKI